MCELPVYLDHASTTPVAPEVLDAMLPYLAGSYGNPSSLHSVGAAARAAVEEAREYVAAALGADADEIVFTSGGTEADNLAVKGVCLAARGERRHVLVSAVEHHAVLDAALWLRTQGFEVELVPADGCGQVSPEAVRERIRPDTALVSVMLANNEVGTIQPVRQIAAACRELGVPMHSDAVQALGQVDVDVHNLGVDLMSLSAHKVYGPKGVGALYVRRGVRLEPLLAGGAQESGIRGGTHNVAGIVGLRTAVWLLGELGPGARARIGRLRDRLISGIRGVVPGARLCGHPTERLPSNAHFCFPGIEAEALLLALDAEGICASAGSACSSGSTAPSHVLLAMGLPEHVARGALRLTLGRHTTAEQVDYVVSRLASGVAELRGLAGL